MLIHLTVVIISQCMCISSHHIVHFKYITGGVKRERKMGESGKGEANGKGKAQRGRGKEESSNTGLAT